MSEAAGPVVQLAECGLHQVPPGGDWLSIAERAVLDGLRVQKRREDWRLGRWCARQAITALHPAPPTDLEILAAADGAPEVRGCAISITHRDGRGAAVACAEGLRLGCDLERVEPRSERFIRDYLTNAECAHVLDASGRARDVLANLCWSAKESVLKAERSGLRADTRSVEVSLEATSPLVQGWQPLRARGAGGAEYTGHWRLDGDWLLTVLANAPHRLRCGHSVF